MLSCLIDGISLRGGEGGAFTDTETALSAGVRAVGFLTGEGSYRETPWVGVALFLE